MVRVHARAALAAALAACVALVGCAGAPGSADPTLTPDPTVALGAASRGGDLDGVRAALNAGADPNADLGVGVRAVHIAAARGYPDLLELLVDRGANINARTNSGATPLLLASTSAPGSMVRLLLDLGADPAISSYALPTQNVLHDAAAAGNVDAVSVLLDAGVDIDIEDTNGTTPLLLSCWFSRTETSLYLIARGADPSQRDARGRTCLDWAIERGDDAVVSALSAIPAADI